MRFLSSALGALAVVGSINISGVAADLRLASQPKNGYKVIDRQQVAFVTNTAVYLEPSAFNYAGLADQRANAYDNFLRSNIDNEQDKRNFNNEAGRDMLPFRTYEAAITDANQATVQTKIPAAPVGPAITATPGDATLVPLRWNNPHASELEVNVWLGADNKVVVPVKKPTCSGEGHQDNVFDFTIPTDFNSALAARVPGFNGCNKVGDCTLQVYAHSVEARTYSIGVPLIVTGGTGLTNTATGAGNIEPAKIEVGTDLARLPQDICLPSNSPAANIASAVPRVARLVSDVFNHAYQNSDYSPYSGQQPEAISKNLQAAAVLSMTTGNRGELGKALLAQTNAAGAALAAKLEAKQKALIVKYEGITNKIIAAIQNDAGVKNVAALADGQNTANCFRCSEVGAVTTNRLTTNTYIPSFQIPAASLAKAKAAVPAQYAQLINADGTLGIYAATLNDMQNDFKAAVAKGIAYQPAMLKPTATTMADATAFKKKNAAGQNDNGQYAASLVQGAKAAIINQKAIPVNPQQVKPASFTGTAALPDSPIASLDWDPTPVESYDPVSGDLNPLKQFPDNGASQFEAPLMGDENALLSDSTCDNDAAYALNPNMECTGAFQLYTVNADGSLSTTAAFSSTSTKTNAAATTTSPASSNSIAAALVVAAAAIYAAAH